MNKWAILYNIFIIRSSIVEISCDELQEKFYDPFLGQDIWNLIPSYSYLFTDLDQTVPRLPQVSSTIDKQPS